MSEPTTLLSVPAAAARFEVHPQTLRRWIKDGVLRTVKSPSGRQRIPAAEVERILSGQKAAS